MVAKITIQIFMFGVGGMIYSTLHVVVYLSAGLDTRCRHVIGVVSAVMHIIFTFTQLYFMFSSSKMCIHKYKTVARFGLMHGLAANMCVRIKYLVKETVDELAEMHNENAVRAEEESPDVELSPWKTCHVGVSAHQGEATHVMAIVKVAVTAEKFLFPCLIEYSLVAAAIMFVMWQNIGQGDPAIRSGGDADAGAGGRAHFRVDCNGAILGLFFGILVFACSLTELILFFHINEDSPGQQELVIFESFLIGLHVIAIIVTAVAIYRLRSLPFREHVEEELDTMLLFIAQFGVFLYAICSIIATNLTLSNAAETLLLVFNIARVLQTCLQTMLIIDGTRRYSAHAHGERPGKQLITFLIAANLSLYILNTFEMLKVTANPVQRNFYGTMACTILTHICTPLAIFYRFHSTVCLAEIWKNAYTPNKH
ncbi:PREDICTED: otopetrin-1-like [Priapulus caudatus]|uniref:Otopetrin-1-like n=1 Tax=Priapulus caudatus TaxID=37621 RepID=A0ABM1F457_PRICU|nr:PREDICTED: otopetrin-1-like [Priapulus caudatus]